jgi:hypothetical protein
LDNERKLKFAIDEIKIIQELSDSQLAIAEVYVCHDGMNSHELPISLDILKKATPTLINKFLVAGFDGEDFKSHERQKQLIIGFFPKENDFKYVKKNDKTYLVANVIISKIYAKWAFDIFSKNNYKECSMEITILKTEIKEDGYEWILNFVFNGVTVLGNKYSAACEGSNVQITKFSLDELIEKGEKVYKNFKNKEDKKLEDFDKKEFAKKLGLTANEAFQKMSEICSSEKYEIDGYNYTKYYVSDYDDVYVYAYSRENWNMVAIPYSISEANEILMNFDLVKEARIRPFVDDEIDDGAIITFVEDIVKENEKQFSDKINNITSEKDALTEEITNLKSKYYSLEKDNKILTEEKENFSEKITELESETTKLKEFKSNVEEQKKKDEIEFAIQSVSTDLTQEQIDEWREKAKDYENIDEYANAIKAFAFDVTKKNPDKKSNFSRIHIPDIKNEPNKESKNLWD